MSVQRILGELQIEMLQVRWHRVDRSHLDFSLALTLQVMGNMSEKIDDARLPPRRTKGRTAVMRAKLGYSSRDEGRRMMYVPRNHQIHSSIHKGTQWQGRRTT